jgi:hypothetical protein
MRLRVRGASPIRVRLHPLRQKASARKKAKNGPIPVRNGPISRDHRAIAVRRRLITGYEQEIAEDAETNLSAASAASCKKPAAGQTDRFIEANEDHEESLGLGDPLRRAELGGDCGAPGWTHSRVNHVETRSDRRNNGFFHCFWSTITISRDRHLPGYLVHDEGQGRTQ